MLSAAILRDHVDYCLGHRLLLGPYTISIGLVGVEVTQQQS